MMLNWFGPIPWDAPICTTCPRCEIPVGSPCGRCEQRLREYDRGVTMPLVKSDNVMGVIAFHIDCHIKSIIPHTRWAAMGLIPSAYDGLDETGRFECKECRVTWSMNEGWRVI